MRFFKLMLWTTIALFSTACLASDVAAAKRANELVSKLTSIDKSICRNSNYRVLFGALYVGSARLEISATTFDKSPCYRYCWNVNFSAAGNSFVGENVAYIAPDMKLLASISKSRENGGTETIETLALKGEEYTKLSTKEDGSAKSSGHKYYERMILEGADELLAQMLPEKAQTYEFNDWSGEWEVTTRTYTVGTETTIGSLKGIAIRQDYFSGGSKSKPLKPRSMSFLVDKKRGLLRMERNNGEMVVELDTGDTSPETFRKYERPIDPVLAFWNAIVAKDAELMSEAINEDRYFEETWAHDAKYSKMTEQERAAAKAAGKGTLGKAMVEKVQVGERERALFKSLSSDDFDLKYESSTRVKIKLNDHYRKRSSDESEMFWIVEFDEDTGKWKFVWLSTNDEEF